MVHYTKRIIVVGAGIGGLSAAIHLAAQGHRVHVLERHAQVGGKLNQLKLDGFNFDTGPSLLTMPAVLHDLFRAAGRRLDDYLDLVPLEITCRYFYRDGVILNAWRDHARLAEEFARLNEHDGEALSRFIAHGRAIYQAAADPFLYHSLAGPFEILRMFMRYVLRGHTGEEVQDPLWKRIRAVQAALSPMTLDQCVREFFMDEHIRQLFDRYATYNGSSPYEIASVYSTIPYVELANGGWYVRGGIYTIAQALERVARELDVCIETGCNVQRILVEQGAACGVMLADGRVLRSDVVVANSDVVTTYSELLSSAVETRRTMKKLTHLEPSSSGFVLLLGVNKQYPQLAHHTIFFSDDYHAEFEDLFKRRVPLSNPTIYVCATSRSDPTQAPPEHENLFVLVNAPYLTKASNWQRDVAAYRERILDLLAGYQKAGLHDLREHIVCERILTPEDFVHLYGANAGAIYGLSSNARLSPFTRPGNRAREVRHLYFVGGSTHPGGGVPLVILSGKIVAGLIGSAKER